MLSLLRRFSAQPSINRIGFIGLGMMGGKMVENLKNDGHNLVVYDKNQENINALVDANKVLGATSAREVADRCNVIISLLPNDAIVTDVSNEILSSKNDHLCHISCSTVSPATSRRLEQIFNTQGAKFVSAPVFARPDGLAKRQATWMVSGRKDSRDLAGSILGSYGNVVDYGDDVGAANVVKLCGNFLIASSIESIAEAMALSEKHGVDRTKVMTLLSSTIFDCLIYKGYGERVSKRDHRPGGFSLALGLKDVSLVSQAAREADVPMPFLSVLLDRYTSAKAKGRADFDWSAIGLNAAEDAGIDVSADVGRNRRDVESGNKY